MMAFVALNSLYALQIDQDRIDAKGKWARGVSMKSHLQKKWPDATDDQYDEAIGYGQASLIELILKTITKDEIVKHFRDFKSTKRDVKKLDKSWKNENDEALDVPVD